MTFTLNVVSLTCRATKEHLTVTTHPNSAGDALHINLVMRALRNRLVDLTDSKTAGNSVIFQRKLIASTI